jgi:pimeloyl-ACP methyl ester carboxylesterase
MNRFFKYFFRSIVVIIILATLIVLSYYQKDIPVEKLIKKYANADSRFMPLMGMQVHYKNEGNQNDSTPLILIHGTASSLFTWDSSVTILKEKHRIIRFDLPAFALTGPSPEKEYSMEFYEHFLDSFLIKLNIKQCILVGNSLGGNIAWRYTLKHPEQVVKLVLVDASGVPVYHQPKGAIGFKIASTPILSSFAKYITPKSLVIKSLHDVYGDKTKIKDWLETRYFDMLLRAGNREALVDRFKFNSKLDESEKIKKINIPTLIVWGDKDQLIPVENAYQFNKLIANSELDIMKGVGHVPMEEEPILFANRVSVFIDKK